MEGATPADVRNRQWDSLDPAVLTGLRQRIYRDLIARGPATTRALALRLEVDILTVRPRVTELFQVGLVELIQPMPRAPGDHVAAPARPTRRPGHEGTYRAVPMQPLPPANEQSHEGQLQLM